MRPSRLSTQLNGWVTRGKVLSAPAQLAGYEADGLGYKRFQPDAVVIPADADELIALLQHARELDLPVCLRGAGTSLSGGPVAAQGGLVVHVSRLKNIRQIDPDGFWCEVECGVTLSQIETALEPHGLFYPPDPSSGPVCTIGGNVAMNAGGAHCFRFGVTGNYVLGVEAVLPDGSVHRFGGPAGGRGALQSLEGPQPWQQDWKRLMVGSEGTLAAFTRFWLRLLPRPEKVWTFRATYPDLVSAERAIHALVAHHAFPVAIELMDPRCVAMVENSPMAVGLPQDSFMILTEIDGPEELVNQRVDLIAELLRSAGSHDVVFSDDADQRRKLWKARKVAGGLMGQISPDLLVQDAVIPKQSLADLLQLIYDEADAAEIPVVNVFHAGDGNLHPNFLFDSRKPGDLHKVEAISKRLMQRVVEVGGTLSGEHGIGNDKAAYMPLVFGPDTLRLQLAVPKSFNPDHQFNPLKVFTQRRFRNGSTNGHPSEKPPVSGEAPSRLFKPFVDEIDGVLCISADAKAEEVCSKGLRFPLMLAADASLREQLAASGFAPGSSRFGPFLDNILGMNWRLPTGRIVRIGERVVKSTTGYDLLRFLLAGASPDLGEPIDFVLRLRPDCGHSAIGRLSGEDEKIQAAVQELLRTCWIHWFDSMDVLMDREETQLRISVNCPTQEWPIYERCLSRLAASHELSFQGESEVAPPVDGLPDFVLKTTANRVLALGEQLRREAGVRCVALCYPGVLHGYLPEATEAAAQVTGLIQPLERQLLEVGGDWHSRHCPRSLPNSMEAAWDTILREEFSAP